MNELDEVGKSLGLGQMWQRTWFGTETASDDIQLIMYIYSKILPEQHLKVQGHRNKVKGQMKQNISKHKNCSGFKIYGCPLGNHIFLFYIGICIPLTDRIILQNSASCPQPQ